MTTDMTGVSPFMTASGIPSVPSGAGITPTGGNIVTVPQEESYIENILRLNRGKLATVYMTFENNSQWNAKVFRGIIEAAGRDHLILSDPSTGTRYLLLMVNLDYVTFHEPINYEYPFQGGIVTQQTPFNTTRENETETDYTDREHPGVNIAGSKAGHGSTRAIRCAQPHLPDARPPLPSSPASQTSTNKPG